MIHDHFSSLPVMFHLGFADSSPLRLRESFQSTTRGGRNALKLRGAASLRFKQNAVLMSSDADLHRRAAVNPRLGEQFSGVGLSGFLQELLCFHKVHPNLPARAAVRQTGAVRGAASIA
jgi:hypothetical protein